MGNVEPPNKDIHERFDLKVGFDYSSRYRYSNNNYLLFISSLTIIIIIIWYWSLKETS